MKTIAFVLAALLCSGCRNQAPKADESSTQIRTIEQEHRPHARAADEVTTSTTTVADAGDRVELPFAPPISMDPVDGSKVSIRRDTPTTEHAGKVYHFSSEENLRLFLESPDKYLRGTLATY